MNHQIINEPGRIDESNEELSVASNDQADGENREAKVALPIWHRIFELFFSCVERTANAWFY